MTRPDPLPRPAGRSQTRTDWITTAERYAANNDFHLSFVHFDENGMGRYMEQLDATGLPTDSDGNTIPHATIGNVSVGYDNYVLSAGRVTYSASWSSGDITSAQVDDYVAWLQAENFGNDIENLSKQATSLSWDFVPKDETGGAYSLVRYQPNTQFKVTVASEDIQMCCLLRAHNKADVWTTGSYSIRGGDTLTINKTVNECYLAFVGETFSINDTAVADKSLKQLTSSSVTVENTGTEVRKIGLIWRN